MVMDQRKSKKTRSYGESPHDARTSKLSGGPLKATRSGRRSSLSDRNRSESLIAKGRKEDTEVRASGHSSRTKDQDVDVSGQLQTSVWEDGCPQPGHGPQQSQVLRPCQPSRTVSAKSRGTRRCPSLQSGDSLLMMPFISHGSLLRYRSASIHRR